MKCKCTCFAHCIATIDVLVMVKAIRTKRHLKHAVRLSGLKTGINYH